MQQVIQLPPLDIEEEEEDADADEINSADWEHVSSLGDADERVNEGNILSSSARQRLHDSASSFLQKVNVRPSQHPIVDQTRTRPID